MAISAVPWGMPVKRQFVTPLKVRGSAAFLHEAEDLVVFSLRLYKKRVTDGARTHNHWSHNPELRLLSYGHHTFRNVPTV